jgi:hypothetical protein
MAQFPDAFGMSVTPKDMDAARRFYMNLYLHDHVSEGYLRGWKDSGRVYFSKTLITAALAG